MKQFPIKYSEIKEKNIIIVLESEEDISILSFLDLEKNIELSIKKSIKNKKSSIKEYFLGEKKYETLYVIVNKEESYEKSVNLLGMHFPKLPDEICIMAFKTETLQMVYEVCMLSRHTLETYKSTKKRRSTQVFLGETHNINTFKTSQERIENICLARDL
jgi:hypothetical protein